ncbi:RNA polymerase sigma factor [Sporomusa aerivorans]|uniref:RNA polymerase sigma factor n=1 Tax=Sporomusa aerivorans TaxID=204936 RepID=UPI00352B83CF
MDEYLVMTAVTPEDVLLEKERMEEIAELLQLIKRNLSEKQFDILWLYSVEGWTQEEIAKKYETYHMKISRALKKTHEICAKIILDPTIVQELFRDPQSKLEAHSPETAGYPYEMLQECNNGGEWKNCGRSGKRWVSKSICRIPEYLQDSFGDLSTTCGLCTTDEGDNKCARKEDMDLSNDSLVIGDIQLILNKYSGI